MALTNADVQFINTYVRPFADWRAKEYYLAKRIVTAWNARGGAAAIPNDAVAVPDGSPADGRGAILDSDVNTIVTRAQEVITDLEATNSAKLNTILKVAVNTLP